ncbi:MAG: FecR domain-containing protein [Myxococcota bacterium]
MNKVKTKSCQKVLNHLPKYIQSSLESAEMEFIREHLEVCSHCSFEYKLMSNLNGLAVDKPLIPKDDLSRRRIVSEVVAKHNQKPSANKKKRSLQLILSGTVAVAAVAIVFAGYFLFYRTDEDDPGRKGQITYVSGRAKLSGRELKPSVEPVVDDKIATRKGEVIYHLPGGTSILQKSDSFVQINSLASRRTSLFLVQGSIFVTVKRQSEDPLVEIATPRGTVKVTGTRFQLEVVKNSVVLRMFRGQVQVITDNGKFQVAGGQSFNLNDSAPDKLSTRTADWLKSNFDRLDYFASGADKSNLIVVDSNPTGARLQVNGIDFGRTPASFRSQDRKVKLQVAHKGFEPFRQSIILQSRENRQIFASLNRIDTRPVVRENNSRGDEFPEKKDSRKKVDKDTDDNSDKEKTDFSSEKIKKRHLSSREDGSENKPKKKLNEYMAAARKFARENKWRQAAAQYRHILKSFPASSLRYTVMIELGEIELDRLGHPDRAKTYFQLYINTRKGGALLQEARWGKIRALGRLGKRKEEIGALKTFIADYPSSYQYKKARHRLKEIQPPVSSSQKEGDTSTSSTSQKPDKTKK